MIDLASQFLRNYLDYNLLGLLNFASSVFTLAIGLIVLLRNPSSKVNIWFFLITLTGAIWLFSYGFVHTIHTERDAYIWLEISYLLSVPFISPCVYEFASEWTGKPNKKRITIIIFSAAATFGLVMFLWAPSICVFQNTPFGRLNLFRETFLPRLYYYAIVAFFSLLAIFSFVKLFIGWRNASSRDQRVQFRQFMIGFLVGYTATVDFMVAGGAKILNFGFISFTLFVLIIAYSIIKHQFLEINLIVKKAALIFLIYIFLFTAAAPLAIPIISGVLKRSGVNSIIEILSLSAAFGLFLSFGPFIYAYLIRKSFWLKGKLTTGLTHELKSPIGAIQGSLEVLSSQLRNDSLDKEKLSAYLEIIQKNTSRMEHYVGDLLHVAKIQDQTVTLNMVQIELGPFIQNIVSSYEPVLQLKSLQVRFQPSEQITIEADSKKMEQAISNILSNAVKFSTNNPINIDLKTSDQSVTLSISDQGCGISKETLHKVFDPFYQGKNINKGSGIGLTIAKAWIEAHRGKIWAESEGEGKGTQVTFTLPLLAQ